MKFSDLISTHRSMLTMLCTGQTFNTEELGRGCNPRIDAQAAARELLDMRTAGLVFSSQKLDHQKYALWRASDYGKAVFDGRPAEVAPPAAKPAEQSTGEGTWVVYKAVSTFQLVNSFSTEQGALTFAASRADGTGDEYLVAKLVARVRRVNVPSTEIERV